MGDKKFCDSFQNFHYPKYNNCLSYTESADTLIMDAGILAHAFINL